jgi:hypothetical protein
MTGPGLAHDGIVVLGPASPSVRRRVGPLAWCALEALHQRAVLIGDALIVELSQNSLARELGVAKNTAHRALKTLRSAGLLQHDQTRGVAGRFDSSRQPASSASSSPFSFPLEARHEPLFLSSSDRVVQTGARVGDRVSGLMLRVTTIHASSAEASAKY